MRSAGLLLLFLTLGSGMLGASDPPGDALESLIEFPDLEIFGGFSVLRLDAGKDVSDRDDYLSLGWEAGVTLRLAPWLGLATDFDGQYQEGAQYYHYLAGPRFYTPLGAERIRGFAHLLVGGVSIRGSRLPAENGFALAAGGGADLAGAFRFQVDYILDRVSGIPNHNARISFGVPFPVDLGWRSR